VTNSEPPLEAAINAITKSPRVEIIGNATLYLGDCRDMGNATLSDLGPAYDNLDERIAETRRVLRQLEALKQCRDAQTEFEEQCRWIGTDPTEQPAHY